jgi:hypothetical protein
MIMTQTQIFLKDNEESWLITDIPMSAVCKRIDAAQEQMSPYILVRDAVGQIALMTSSILMMRPYQ